MKSQDLPADAMRYRAFVVRCWQEVSDHTGRQKKLWRFSWQDPSTGRRRGFATLEALLISLQAELAGKDID